MKIEMWDIDRPKDYPKNARKWGEQAIAKVGSSIKQYGWRQPVVVDRDEVIVIGHLRRAAGKSVGETQCPVHVADNLTATQIRGLRLADNRTNQESDWDIERLTAEFAELKALNFDLAETAFDLSEIDRLLEPAQGLTDPDEVPPIPAEPVTRPGDLWILGSTEICPHCGGEN